MLGITIYTIQLPHTSLSRGLSNETYIKALRLPHPDPRFGHQCH
jgi:hypothetical protein